MRGRSVVIAIAAAASLALVGGIAYATIPDSAGVIHGCYRTQSGQLRVIDSGGCSPSEAALNWNQTGPAGPPGPSGTLAWAHVASNGTLLGSSGNVAVARAGPGYYCVAVTGDTAHAAMAVLDANANIGGTIQTAVFFPFFPADCPSNAYYILVVTRPQDQDGGLPGADRAYYLVVS
jgi:hypothetical protein